MLVGTLPQQCPEAAVLHERIEVIIRLIPDGFEKKDSLVHDLKGRQHSIHFTAPTAVPGRWHEVSRILEGNLLDPTEAAWAAKISEVFSAEY